MRRKGSTSALYCSGKILPSESWDSGKFPRTQDRAPLTMQWQSHLLTYPGLHPFIPARGATWTSLCFKNKLIKHRSAPQRGQTHHCVSPGSQLGEYPKSCFYFSSPTPKTLYSYFSPLAVCLRKMDRFLHTRLSLATIICWRFQEFSFLFPASPHQSEPS